MECFLLFFNKYFPNVLSNRTDAFMNKSIHYLDRGLFKDIEVKKRCIGYV